MAYTPHPTLLSNINPSNEATWIFFFKKCNSYASFNRYLEAASFFYFVCVQIASSLSMLPFLKGWRVVNNSRCHIQIISWNTIWWRSQNQYTYTQKKSYLAGSAWRSKTQKKREWNESRIQPTIKRLTEGNWIEGNGIKQRKERKKKVCTVSRKAFTTLRNEQKQAQKGPAQWRANLSD